MIQQWWDYARYLATHHPVVALSAFLFVVLLSVLLAALFSYGSYRKKLLKGKARRTWLPFVLVAMFTFAIPPLLWYFGRLTPAENIRLTKSKYLFGIDVSHYQGTIDWAKVKSSHHPIRYVFVRATMGSDGTDAQFTRNWEHASRQGYLLGAYHYFRPGEDGRQQFEQFRKVVRLSSGDLPPVLDIEELGGESPDVIREQVKIWLQLAEKAYGVKPVIYSGRNFYLYHLQPHLDGYPLWIAAYDGEHRVSQIRWAFHQFTDLVHVSGIREAVDGNNFNGNELQLKALCLP